MPGEGRPSPRHLQPAVPSGLEAGVTGREGGAGEERGGYTSRGAARASIS